MSRLYSQLALLGVAMFCLSLFPQLEAQVCSISGDPHYQTFDNLYHDFQGRGKYVLARHRNLQGFLEVQATMVQCNPAAKRFVSCLRDFNILYGNPYSPRLPAEIITHGQWGNTIDTVKFCKRDDPASCVTKPVTDYTTATLSPYSNTIVQWVPSSRRLVLKPNPQACSFCPTITTGLYFFHMSTNRDSPLFNGVEGLCGTFNADHRDEFTGSDGVNYFASVNLKPGTRYNTAATNSWGETFYVDGTNITELSLGHYQWQKVSESENNEHEIQSVSLPSNNEEDMVVHGHYVNEHIFKDAQGADHQIFADKEGKHYILRFFPMNLPAKELPTPEQQAALQQVEFGNVDEIDETRKRCAQDLGTVQDNAQLENCMYDNANVGDYSVALANVVSAVITNEALNPEGSSGSSDNTEALTVGLVVGFVALAAIVVAGVLFVKYRKVKEDYSRALILRNSGSSGHFGGTTSSAAPAEMELSHAENL